MPCCLERGELVCLHLLPLERKGGEGPARYEWRKQRRKKREVEEEKSSERKQQDGNVVPAFFSESKI